MEKELKDLIEFLNMLDFTEIFGDKIMIVSNYFRYEELPETVQKYLKNYFAHLKSID